MHLARCGLAVSLLSMVLAHPVNQFENIGSRLWPELRDILNDQCRQPYTLYRTGHQNATNTWRMQTLSVVECALGNMSEVRKTNLGVSAVVLGSTPMVLQTLGSGSVELALLGLRRPVLSLLLSAASPSPATIKSSEYIELLSTFIEGGDGRSLMSLEGLSFEALPVAFRPLMSVLEYTITIGAVANVAHLGYLLGFRGVATFAPDTRWMPLLWAFVAVVIHMAGSLALRLRVRMRKAPVTRGAYVWAPDELVPSAYQSLTILAWRSQSIVFHTITWILGVATVTNVIFGTLLLSSLLFYTGTDAVVIVARFAASAIVARVVVRIELAGMREVTKYHRKQEDQLQGETDKLIKLREISK